MLFQLFGIFAVDDTKFEGSAENFCEVRDVVLYTGSGRKNMESKST